MTQQFMADNTIRERYGFQAGANFEDTFSAVSLESIWFSIVASAIYVLETLFDAFKQDVDAKIAEAVLASIPWYHKISLEFQYGDSLVFDERTQQYVYPEVDESKRIVKFAACRDLGGIVYVLASKAGADGAPTPLSTTELTAFDSYLRQRKPAGVILQSNSLSPDLVRPTVRVQYNPQILSSAGRLLADPNVRPVEDAINQYLADIVYGGDLNKTKLVDAIQQAEGVVDVVLDSVKVKPGSVGSYITVTGNNYTSTGGSFKTQYLSEFITYVLSL